MHERLGSLRRLLRVYEVVEKVHEAEASRAALGVREVERAIDVENRRSCVALECERQALGVGDWLGRSLAMAQQRTGDWRRTRLTSVLHERQEHSVAARRRHMESKQWSERVQRLANRVTEDAAKLEEKQQQMVTDDRFLSRRRWMHGRLENRING